MFGYTDRHAGTVFKVWEQGQYTYVEVRNDKVKRIDNNGMSESQTYEYTTDPEGTVEYFRIKTDQSTPSRWHRCYKSMKWCSETHESKWNGRWKKSNYGGVAFGYRSYYYDFSF